MTDQQRDLVLRILRDAYDNGIAQRVNQCGFPNGLPMWKRLINWSFRRADQQPFRDQNNFDFTCRGWPFDRTLEAVLRELSPEPKCKKCGSTRFTSDPAGYYKDAVNWRGAPLLCLDCPN